jgi:transcriptional regulator with XRE-family HTH domain
MSDFDRNLGAIVRATRERQALSVTELAGAADVDEARLRALEQGEPGTTYGQLLRVARALGMPPPELVELAERGATDSTPGRPNTSEAE